MAKNMAKGKLRQFITTLLMVAMLTCLIWVYADQVTSETAKETITLRILTPKGSDLVIESPGDTVQLDVIFSGPHVQLQDFRKQLAAVNFMFTYYLPAGDPDRKLVTLNTRETIVPLLRERLGTISVTDVSPEQITLTLDRYITESIDVRAPTESVKTTTPEIIPPKVNVRIRKSLFDRWEDPKFVTVNIVDQLRDRQAGEQIDETFPVSQALPSGQPIETNPTRVRVRLRLEKEAPLAQSFLLSEPYILGPAELFGKYRVVIKESRVTVSLIGPKDVIQNLKPQDIIPFIRLAPDEVPRETPFPREVEFLLLPKGVQVNPTATQPTVYYELVPIAPAAKPPP